MSGLTYLSAEEAVDRPGLRMAFTRGVPGPWSEAAKAIFQIKGIDFLAVAQEAGQANEALQAWTGQNSAPVAVLDRERPRSHWSEILMLAERLGAEPQLVPHNEEQRTEMFGLAHAICGEDGFGWACRLIMLDTLDRLAGFPPEQSPVAAMRRKFDSGGTIAHARARVLSILAMLTRRMNMQKAAGHAYLVGGSLTAADIYWTTFSNLVRPMAAADCPMPDFYRHASPGTDPAVAACVSAILIDHRERILHRYFQLPMCF